MTKESKIKRLIDGSTAELQEFKTFALLKQEERNSKYYKYAIEQGKKLLADVKDMCDIVVDENRKDVWQHLSKIQSELSQARKELESLNYSEDQSFEFTTILFDIRLEYSQLVKDGYHTKLERQTTKEPHPEPQNCENGESKGNGTETPSEALEMEKLPTTLNDEEMRRKEQQVFYKAITEKYMKLNADGSGYIWMAAKNLLGYLCGRLYCGDEVRDKSHDSYEKIVKKVKGKDTLHNASKLKTLFNGVDVANSRSQIFKGAKKPPKGYEMIDAIFSQTDKTGK